MKPILTFSLISLLLHALTSHAAPAVTNIARGSVAEHSLFIKSDGSLWGMGHDYSGQLGTGTLYPTPTSRGTNRPEQIVTSGVTAIAAGGGHSLFVKSDGSLWAMGDNFYGQLGDGTSFNQTNRPEQIVAGAVTAVAAGFYHSLFLKSDGSLWGMGYTINDYAGQPEQIVASDVTAIAAGYYHSLFLKSDGSLWAMGDNSEGQLGDGGRSSTNNPKQIVSSGVTAIAAGALHSLFLRSDGSLWAMGYNPYGQLGDGTFNNTNQPEQIVAGGVTAIAAGGYHSLFLKSDGSLWAMGANSYGQLGGMFSNTNRPQQIVVSGVTAIAAGLSHSLFLKSDGSLWAMGANDSGQLGDGFIDYIPHFPTDPPDGTATPEQIVPRPQPVLRSALSSKTNLLLKATCGFGGNLYLLGSADLGLPLNQWTPVLTNSVTRRGTNNFSATLTNVVNSSSYQFYILHSH